MARLLRQLCAVYVIAAGLYSSIIVVNARPELAQNVRALAADAAHTGSQAANNAVYWLKIEGKAAAEHAVAWVDRTREEFVSARGAARTQRETATRVASASPRPNAGTQQLSPAPVTPPERESTLIQKISPVPPPALREGLAPHTPRMRDATTVAGGIPRSQSPVSDPELVPNAAPPGAGETARAEERLRLNLTRELLANFDLFLYVSKAEQGPLAQRMYVVAKQESGDLSLLHAWPVSTGLQQRVLAKTGWRYALETPNGYFQLDPDRFHVRYVSNEWGLPMPHAMFFNWVRNGEPTGFAIHGVSGEEIALLGKKASAGCVRLATEHARQLFDLIRKNYRGRVPRFAMDVKSGTMNRDGLLWYGRNGKPKMADGYRVLVFIEDYGGEDVVAVLY
ncbi:MAG: L,D-transpeptidase family protein [Alphaproteobacteria bacterium]